MGAIDGTIHYFRNDNGVFNEIIGSNNPFNNVNVGNYATPGFFRFDANAAYVGSSDGIIREYEKIGNQYVPVLDSPFKGVNVGILATPTVADITSAYPGKELVIGVRNGNVIVYSEHGSRSNV